MFLICMDGPDFQLFKSAKLIEDAACIDILQFRTLDTYSECYSTCYTNVTTFFSDIDHKYM